MWILLRASLNDDDLYHEPLAILSDEDATRINAGLESEGIQLGHEMVLRKVPVLEEASVRRLPDFWCRGISVSWDGKRVFESDPAHTRSGGIQGLPAEVQCKVPERRVLPPAVSRLKRFCGSPFCWGVHVRVEGSDPEACVRLYEEKRAWVLEDPLRATVLSERQYRDECLAEPPVPYTLTEVLYEFKIYLSMPANARLRDALKDAGLLGELKWR